MGPPRGPASARPPARRAPTESAGTPPRGPAPPCPQSARAPRNRPPHRAQGPPPRSRPGTAPRQPSPGHWPTATTPLSRPERGLHPLGLLPQPGHLLPDVLLPRLQQSEHRRHDHLRERHEQTNHPNHPAREGSARSTSQNQKITFGKRMASQRVVRVGNRRAAQCHSWSKRVGWVCRQAVGNTPCSVGEGLGRAAGARPVVRLGGRGRRGWNGEAYANDAGIPAP